MRHQHQGAIGRHPIPAQNRVDRIERRVFRVEAATQSTWRWRRIGKVLPSGADFATKSGADVAAGTRHVLHQHSLPRPLRQARHWIVRAMVSMPVPGVNGTMILMGVLLRSGGLCKTCNANKRRQYRPHIFC
jgi:hypothetical protein